MTGPVRTTGPLARSAQDHVEPQRLRRARARPGAEQDTALRGLHRPGGHGGRVAGDAGHVPPLTRGEDPSTRSGRTERWPSGDVRHLVRPRGAERVIMR